MNSVVVFLFAFMAAATAFEANHNPAAVAKMASVFAAGEQMESADSLVSRHKRQAENYDLSACDGFRFPKDSNILSFQVVYAISSRYGQKDWERCAAQMAVALVSIASQCCPNSCSGQATILCVLKADPDWTFTWSETAAILYAYWLDRVRIQYS